MEENTIRLIVQAPEAFSAEIEQFIAENQSDDLTIEQKIIPPSETGQKDLGFEPITGTAIILWGLKFVGGVASTVATKFIADKLYDWLKKKSEGGEGKVEAKVELPDGDVVELSPDKSLDLPELENKIKQNENL